MRAMTIDPLFCAAPAGTLTATTGVPAGVTFIPATITYPNWLPFPASAGPLPSFPVYPWMPWPYAPFFVGDPVVGSGYATISGVTSTVLS